VPAFSSSSQRHRATLLALAVAIAGGAAFNWLGSPLPWLLGPLLCCAAINLATGRLHSPRTIRKAGQWVIGLALGLYFSAGVIAHLARFSGWIFAGVVWAFVLGFGLAWLMERLGGMDRPTAFFAAAIGGASEMMLQAEREGGNAASVAASHSVRIMMVVVTIPFIYRALDLHGSDRYLPAVTAVHHGGLLALVAVTLAGGLLMERLRSPNAWVIGPLLISGTLTALGFQWSAVPSWLAIAGQVAIGMTLGTRFTPAFYRSAPRVVVSSIVVTAVAMIACSAFGWLLGSLSGISPATMILATSPGGLPEMSLTARNLELGVPMVTAFHATRMAALVLCVGGVYRFAGRRRARGEAAPAASALAGHDAPADAAPPMTDERRKR
jgi:membrane AbrB-like protein